MKRSFIFLLVCLALGPGISFASEGAFGGAPPHQSSTDKEENVQHVLDGTIIEYQYQNGWAIHMELYNGMLKYEWIAGPPKGKSNQDLQYRSRKIGPNMYLINWYEESKPDFITLVFNFDNNVMYSSGLLMIGTKEQFSLFHGGIIDEVTLVVN